MKSCEECKKCCRKCSSRYKSSEHLIPMALTPHISCFPTCHLKDQFGDGCGTHGLIAVSYLLSSNTRPIWTPPSADSSCFSRTSLQAKVCCLLQPCPSPKHLRAAARPSFVPYLGYCQDSIKQVLEMAPMDILGDNFHVSCIFHTALLWTQKGCFLGSEAAQ